MARINNKVIIFAIISALIRMAPAPRNKNQGEQKSLAESKAEKEKDEHEFFQTQQERMAFLLETGHSSDVQFLVGNDATRMKLFHAHTFVLGIGNESSEKFKGQFRMNEATNWPKDEPIKVTDVEPDAFSAMLHYLYLGDLSKITKENVAHVLDAAKKYLIPNLVKKCIHLAMTSMLDMENVIDLWNVAKWHDEIELTNHCLTFIDQNIADFIKMDEFMALDQKEIAEIFARDTIDSDELALFQALDRWAHKQCLKQKIKHPSGEEKRDAMGLALNSIRFPLINLEDFKDKIVPTGILDENTQRILLKYFKHKITKARLPFSFVKRKIPRNNKFSAREYYRILAISGNGLVLTHRGINNFICDDPDYIELASAEPITAYATLPISPFNQWSQNSYIAAYFEVQILNEMCQRIRIGFCDENSEWKVIHSETGTVAKLDVIGVGLFHSPENNLLQSFHTFNGAKIDAFNLDPKFIGMPLFPAITLFHKGDSIKANFDKPKWVYNPLHLLNK